MSKELEALEGLSELAITPDLKVLPKFDGWTRIEVMNRYKPIIETALKELNEYKSILKDFGLENPQNLIDNLNIIKDSKFHEKIKALEIVKDKQVEVCYFMNCETLEEYNDDVIAAYAYEEDAAKQRMLTQEEYDLLKEVLK